MKRFIPLAVLVLFTACATVKTKWHETFSNDPTAVELIIGDWAAPRVDKDQTFVPPAEGQVPHWSLKECGKVLQFYQNGEFHEISWQGNTRVDDSGQYSFFGDRSMMLRYAKEDRRARLDYEFKSKDMLVFAYVPGSNSKNDRIETYYRFKLEKP